MGGTVPRRRPGDGHRSGTPDQARAWFFGHNVDSETVGVNTYFGGLPLYLAALDEASRDGYPSLQTSHGQTASSL